MKKILCECRYVLSYDVPKTFVCDTSGFETRSRAFVGSNCT